jgi:hypothetical protein
MIPNTKINVQVHDELNITAQIQTLLYAVVYQAIGMKFLMI